MFMVLLCVLHIRHPFHAFRSDPNFTNFAEAQTEEMSHRECICLFFYVCIYLCARARVCVCVRTSTSVRNFTVFFSHPSTSLRVDVINRWTVNKHLKDSISIPLVYLLLTSISHVFALQCVKSAGVRRFTGPYFPVFGLNTKR